MCPEINNLAFIHSSVEDADFQSDSLDVVLCHNGIFYFQDPQLVVNRVFEWLRKPGGRFVFNAQQVICRFLSMFLGLCLPSSPVLADLNFWIVGRNTTDRRTISVSIYRGSMHFLP